MSFSNCTGVSSGNPCPKALTSIFNHEEKDLFAFLGRFLFQLENFKDSRKLLFELVHYFLKQDKFEDAIPLLRSTVKNEPVKSNKARY